MNDSLPFIPAALDDAGLSPRAFRLYCHLCRRGAGWGSVENMARVCAMNRKTILAALAELMAAGLALRESRPGRTSVYRPLPVHAMAGDGEEHPAPKTGHHPAQKADRHPVRKTDHEGYPEKVLQRRRTLPLSPPPATPPGAAEKEKAGFHLETADGNRRAVTPVPLQSRLRRTPPRMASSGVAMWQTAEAIVSLYPVNGCRLEAARHCLRSLKRGEDAKAMAAAVSALAERWKALPPEARRFCPSLSTFFRDERWRDSPDLHPWRVFSAPAAPRSVSSPCFPATRPLAIRRL